MNSWTPKSVGITAIQGFIGLNAIIYSLQRMQKINFRNSVEIIIRLAACIFADVAAQKAFDRMRPDLSFRWMFACVLGGAALHQLHKQVVKCVPQKLQLLVKLTIINFSESLIIGSFAATVARHPIFKLPQERR